MEKTAIVYWSGTGNTEAMAQEIAAGVTAAGGAPELIPAASFSADQVANYRAIAFGCPSMGVEELEDTEFEPMFSAVKPQLSGKTIGLFGSYGWGDGEWMRNWEDECKQAGCLLAAPPVITCEAPDDEAATACRALGEALTK